MRSFKIEVMRRLQDFNNQTIGDNTTLDSLKAHRMAIARSAMGKLGEDTNIETPFFCGWGCNIFIGDGVYINREFVLFSS
jgi:maltose O-acetyltransferase